MKIMGVITSRLSLIFPEISGKSNNPSCENKKRGWHGAQRCCGVQHRWDRGLFQIRAGSTSSGRGAVKATGLVLRSENRYKLSHCII